jgi:hypothetical protein
VALKAKNWKDKKYGVDFWTPLIEEYNTLYSATNSTTGTISKVVQDKNDCRKKIQNTLNGLVLVIKANYPDTYTGELRNWGFQKEKY